MKRTYAFEADASTEVKDMLEKVETVVDEKCESVEDCEKIEEKIEKVEDKFNGALQGMADAAKEGGDKDELKEKIDPHMADLKEIAKDIGIATESEVVTDQELKDVKSYIEGAKEIVEAKKDELEDAEKCPDGECDGKKDDKEEKEDSDDDEECEEGACESAVLSIANESFILPDQTEALEAYLEDLAIESDFALEGYNRDLNKEKKSALKAAKAKIKEAKAYAKQGDVAATKAAINECVTNLEAARNEFNNSLKAGKVTDAIIGNAVYSLQMILVTLASAFVGYTIGAAIGTGAAARSVAGATNAAKHAAGTVGKAKAAATAAAKGLGRSVNDLGGVKDVAGFVGKNTAIIGGGVGSIGNVLSAVVVLVRAFKKKKSGGELSPSDFNMLAQRTADAFDKSIAAIKATGDKLVAKAEKKAAKSAATESFVNALEALMIEKTPVEPKKAPYLFD